MKVALVHDFLIEYGGAERVLEALHEIWPKAPLYTAFYNPQTLGPHTKKFKGWKIVTGWGTKLPLWQKLVSPYRVFSKSFFEHFDLSGFDLVVSSSNMYMAKAVIVPNGVHVCYCHTPPRFLYGYPTALNWRKNPLLRPIGEVINHFLRVWDFDAAQQPFRGSTPKAQSTPSGVEPQRSNGRVDYFIANSREVQARIKKFYRRDSVVIYPPVDTKKFQISNFKFQISNKSRNQQVNGKWKMVNGKYFLVVSRLVGAKKVDLAIEVCAKLGLALKVVGSGRELENLKTLVRKHSGSESGSTIDFLGEVPDNQLINLYQNCRAVIFPAEQEDFGLVPVEAMAAGKPVIANAQGGVLESIIDPSTRSARSGQVLSTSKGKCTGVYFEPARNKLSYFDPATVGSLTLAINNFIDLEKKGYFDPKFIRRHAQKFSKERFKREILKFVEGKVR